MYAEADDDGLVTLQHDGTRMAVDAPGRVFKRRAIKAVGTPAAREVSWLVGELDGVRCYVMGDGLIRLTTQDLTP